MTGSRPTDRFRRGRFYQKARPSSQCRYPDSFDTATPPFPRKWGRQPAPCDVNRVGTGTDYLPLVVWELCVWMHICPFRLLSARRSDGNKCDAKRKRLSDEVELEQ